MQPQTVVVLGATGLVGNEVVKQLLKDDAFATVRILVRRPLAITHQKLEISIVDFDDINDFKNKLGKGDCIFCCIGTTMKKVKGDKTAYREIDHDIAVHAAELGKEAGFKTYLLVSSVGANANSNNFYLKLKGETEMDVTAVNLHSVYIFRPSFLLGDRNEVRLGEALSKGIFKAASKLFFGSMTKYKPIEAADVAKAMISAANLSTHGVHVCTYKEIMG